MDLKVCFGSSLTFPIAIRQLLPLITYNHRVISIDIMIIIISIIEKNKIESQSYKT